MNEKRRTEQIQKLATAAEYVVYTVMASGEGPAVGYAALFVELSYTNHSERWVQWL